MNHKRSQELHQEAVKRMPGGVSSPIRAIRPYPLYIDRGEGRWIWDVDGNRYVDYCLGYGPLILGHAPPQVQEAVSEQMSRGSGFGAPTEKEKELVDALCEIVPCADMVRMVNSGTEATMHAIRLARGFTGRDRVVKLDGGFHGAHDSLMVQAGSGILEQGLPQCAGVPDCLASLCSVAPFNDLEAMSTLLETEEFAALILEPVMGNCGTILAEPGYLEGLRKLCDETGTLLIFDEVITGLRIAPGGAQERFSIMPDLCTMGKAIGGGLPIGAFMGRREIMENISPSGSVYQAGTFSGNPLTAAAGLAAIDSLGEREYLRFERQGDALRTVLRDTFADRGMEACVQGIGSMFQFFLGRSEVRNAAEARECDAEMFRQLFQEMLREGIYMMPSQFETNFLSLAHEDSDLIQFNEALDRCLRRLTQ